MYYTETVCKSPVFGILKFLVQLVKLVKQIPVASFWLNEQLLVLLICRFNFKSISRLNRASLRPCASQAFRRFAAQLAALSLGVLSRLWISDSLV